MFKLRHILLAALFLQSAVPASAAEPVKVIVSGVSGDALKNVKAALAVPPALVQDGVVNRQWLERFVSQVPERARRALEPFGYYDAKIRADLEQLTEKTWRIAVTITPGEPVRVAGVSVSLQGPGAGEEGLKKLAEAFPLKQGDILIQARYEEAKAALRSRAVDSGYLDAAYTVHEIRVAPAEYSAVIELELQTGQRYFFGEVRIEGAPRYPEGFVRRYVTIKKGDVFSYARLGETQLNLAGSERFREVVPVPEISEARDAHIPVVLRLEEAPTRRLRPGVGYETDVGPRFTLEYRDMNVFDRGQEFHTELNLSERLKILAAGYVLPDFKDIDGSTALQTRLRREDVSAYTSEAATAEAIRTRGFGRGRTGAAYLRVEREDSTVGQVLVRSFLVLPGLRFSVRRFDNPVRPNRGHYYSVDLSGTDEALGSNTRFSRVVAEGGLLTRLSPRLLLSTRARAGSTFLNAPVSTLPVSYRFFAGGDRSVRGYAYQSLGPRDAAGGLVGGKNLLSGSVELERALFTKWAAAVFYDAGNAFDAPGRVRLFQGAGVGGRYYSVIGALRLDLARQLAVPSPAYRVHFTVGFAF